MSFLKLLLLWVYSVTWQLKLCETTAHDFIFTLSIWAQFDMHICYFFEAHLNVPDKRERASLKLVPGLSALVYCQNVIHSVEEYLFYKCVFELDIDGCL